jgi:UDP:flavonoid glycosyltransferase YjiC (YdhE family)
LALGVALRQQGHEPMLALPAKYAEIAARLDLPMVPLPLPSALDFRNGTGGVQLPDEAAVPALSELYQSLVEICRNADVLVAGPGGPACYMAHETLSIPYVTLHRASPGMNAGLDGAVAASALNECRRLAGLLPLGDPLIMARASAQLALHAVSQFLPSAPVAGPSVKAVGFFDLESEATRDQAELEQFFAAGPPIVVMSQTPEESDAMLRLLQKSITEKRHRVVFQFPMASESMAGPASETSGLLAELGGRICFTNFIPRLLLRNAALIAHNGGAEASIAAFRAGVPAIVMPRTPEQFSWAELAKSMGCARHVIPAEHVTVARISAAIQGTLGSSQHSAAASALAGRMETEGGAATAVELIEQLAGRAKAATFSHAASLVRAEFPALVRVERGHDIPASFAQERLWFFDQLAPGNPAYNMPLSLRLKGPLDVQALRRGLTELVMRHESLRTTFETSAEGLVQKIAPAPAVDFDLLDLEILPEQQRESEALKMAQTEAAQPFDLGRGPLLRTRLLKLGPRDHVLLLTVHHIVSDGWSVSILTRELASMYDAYVKGEAPCLPELSVQYADFAVWQRALLGSPALEAQLEYWRRQLQGVETLDLPTDRPRPKDFTARGGRIALRLENGLLGQLRKLCRQEGATLFMALLAAFQLLLAKYSGQHDIAVGTAIANRTRNELEGIVGCFINSLVLRTGLAGNPSLRDRPLAPHPSGDGAQARHEYGRSFAAGGIRAPAASARLE